jgi:hypothetical protein
VGSGHGGGRNTHIGRLKLVPEEEECRRQRVQENGGEMATEKVIQGLELDPLFVVEVVEGACNSPPILTPGLSDQWGN